MRSSIPLRKQSVRSSTAVDAVTAMIGIGDDDDDAPWTAIGRSNSSSARQSPLSTRVTNAVQPFDSQCRMHRVALIPSMFGIMISMRTRLNRIGSPWMIKRQASMPSLAISCVWPRFFSNLTITFWLVILSSTTKMCSGVVEGRDVRGVELTECDCCCCDVDTES